MHTQTIRVISLFCFLVSIPLFFVTAYFWVTEWDQSPCSSPLTGALNLLEWLLLYTAIQISDFLLRFFFYHANKVVRVLFQCIYLGVFVLGWVIWGTSVSAHKNCQANSANVIVLVGILTQLPSVAQFLWFCNDG